MIAYIKGILTEAYEDSVVVEQGGIGFQILKPASLRLPPCGSEITLFTCLYIREDDMSLYGFLTKEDVSFFRLLLTVSGIGPRGALGILSSISPDDLRFAILSDDAKTIAKAPGIGIKTAKKMIIELKDKLDLAEAVYLSREHAKMEQEPVTDAIRAEAVEALTALGYSGTDALRAVRRVELTENMTVEELLKASLKNIL